MVNVTKIWSYFTSMIITKGRDALVCNTSEVLREKIAEYLIYVWTIYNLNCFEIHGTQNSGNWKKNWKLYLGLFTLRIILSPETFTPGLVTSGFFTPGLFTPGSFSPGFFTPENKIGNIIRKFSGIVLIKIGAWKKRRTINVKLNFGSRWLAPPKPHIFIVGFAPHTFTRRGLHPQTPYASDWNPNLVLGYYWIPFLNQVNVSFQIF